MFPLDMPLRLVKRYGDRKTTVLDPFCGRGTTNFAARLHGLNSIGIDVSPVATAITEAAVNILRNYNVVPPKGEFWSWAYGKETLKDLASLRKGLIDDSGSPERKILRAIIMGALHGPLTQNEPSYFSNQAPRTFAPKPQYSVKFWRDRKLYPTEAAVIPLITRKAKRYLKHKLPSAKSHIFNCDSKQLDNLDLNPNVGLIITSPPYYGMRTYIPDQWIRNWFLGGPEHVDYNQPKGSVIHSSPDEFASELRSIWRAAANISVPHARLVVRFGGICNRNIEPREIANASFNESGWKISRTICAGSAKDGRRQALQFGHRGKGESKLEYDFYAKRV